MRGLVSFLLSGWLYLNIINGVYPARILVIFPLKLTSNIHSFRPLLDELAKRGHQVTAYSVIPRGKPLANYTEVIIKPNSWAPQLHDLDLMSLRKMNAFQYIEYFRTHVPPAVDATLLTKEMQSLIHSEEKYDLIIVEAFWRQEQLLAFGHKFNAPVICLHSVFMAPLFAEFAGVPHTFSYIPDYRLPFSDHMTFWQRTKNTLVGIYDIIGGELFYIPSMDRRMRRIFNYSGSENMPSLRNMIQDVSLWIVNSHHLLNYVRPYAPNVVEVAGMTLKTVGKLPPNLQSYMDNATDGVIYVSFGTYVEPSMLTEQQTSTFIEVFRKLKQKIIWKWNGEIPNKPENVLTDSWFPQVDILGHPNCKLIITHCGSNGLAEAMSIGVPVIGIPFFGDHFFYAAYYEEKNVGLVTSLDSLNEHELLEKINTVINTPSFSENARKIANLLNDQPETSLQRAVYWTEYVIRHKGAAHLKPASAKLPYYQFLLLDVIAFLVLCLSSVTFILIWAIYKTVRKFSPKHNSKLKRDKKHSKKNQ